MKQNNNNNNSNATTIVNGARNGAKNMGMINEIMSPKILVQQEDRCKVDSKNPDYCMVDMKADTQGIISQLGGVVDEVVDHIPIVGSIKKKIEEFENKINPGCPMRFSENNTGYDMDRNVVNGGVSAPVALRQSINNAQPHFLESTAGTIRIQHREMISVLNGVASEDFSTSFRVQPANSTTFPWLSKIANLFESYTFQYLRFIYVPRLPTSTAGQIGLALDFDADDAAASSLVSFSQYQHSVIGSVWAGLSLTAEGEALVKCVKERYTDHNTGPHAYDPILHDVANLRVAVLTTPVEVLGQLYVEYDIILRTPEPYAGIGISDNVTQFSFVPSGAGTTMTWSTLYGDGNSPSSMVYYKNELEVYHVASYAGSGCIVFTHPGTYLLRNFLAYNYAAGDWDTAAKAFNNVRCTGGIIYSPSHPVTIKSHWPVASLNQVEVSHVDATDYLNWEMLLTITTPNTPVWITITPAANSGYVAVTNPNIEKVYVYVQRLESTDGIPKIGTPISQIKTWKDTLSSQQLANPLGSRDKTSRRRIFNLQSALQKMMNNKYVAPNKIKLKKNKVNSNKKNRKKPNSKK